MDQERKRMLDEIGFDEISFNFKARPTKETEYWNLLFKKLQDYYEEHGHCELFGLSNVAPLS
jgi:hypothetical protein